MPISMKDIISNELYNMAKTKNIDKITVKSIIEKCGISRQTFYYHFRDIMDVVEYSIKKNTEELVKKSFKAENPRDAIRIFVDAGVDNYPLLKKLFESQKRAEAEKLMTEAIHSYLYEMAKRNGLKASMTYENLETALEFYTYGIAGLLLANCGQQNMNRETLANQIYLIITGEIFIKSQQT